MLGGEFMALREIGEDGDTHDVLHLPHKREFDATWSLIQPAERAAIEANVVAVTLVVNMLHNLHEETGARVVTFIHDEQNQFIKHIKFMHSHSKQFQLDCRSKGIKSDKQVQTFCKQ
jgi:hypothetical protein